MRAKPPHTCYTKHTRQNGRSKNTKHTGHTSHTETILPKCEPSVLQKTTIDFNTQGFHDPGSRLGTLLRPAVAVLGQTRFPILAQWPVPTVASPPNASQRNARASVAFPARGALRIKIRAAKKLNCEA